MYKVIGNYRLSKTLSLGNSTKTKLCVNMSNGKVYVSKQFPKEFLDNHNVIERLRKMFHFDHPLFLSIVDVLKGEKLGYIISEISDGGEVFMRINEFSQNKIRSLFSQLVDALIFLKNQGLFIGNLKPEKLLLNIEQNLQITNFALSLLENENGMYSAPEEHKSIASDIYSAGLILYSMLTKRIPNNVDQLDFDGLDSRAVDLIKKMIDPVPEKRIGLEEIKNDSWLIGRKQELVIKEIQESYLADEISKENDLNAFEIVGKAMSIDLKPLIEKAFHGFESTSFIVEKNADSVYDIAKQKLLELKCKCSEKGNGILNANFDIEGQTVVARVEIFQRNLTTSRILCYRISGESLYFNQLYNSFKSQFDE